MPASDRPTRVAIVDNSVFPEIYKPVEHWTQFLPKEIAWEAFAARHDRFPDLDRFTHVILTGSEASILEPEEWVFKEAEVVRDAVHKGLPVLGSCWGHQLLAFALLGPAHVGRARRPEIGWIAIRITLENDLLGPKTDEAYTFSSHFDEVRNPERMFDVLASSGVCPVQAMRLKDRPVWGLQCHPELDIRAGREFLRDLAEAGFKGQAELRNALASTPRDSGLIRRIVPAFLGSAAQPEGLGP